MNVCGVDYSTRAIDLVFIHLDDLEPPRWHRIGLDGADAFDRTRTVHLPGSLWDDTLAVGIEEPRGHNAGSIYRIQGALLAALPRDTLVHPWIPSAWRKAVGLKGNASKEDVRSFVTFQDVGRDQDGVFQWPQDACDAYCIALATSAAISREQAA